MSQIRTIDQLDVSHKVVLCRVDLNVPMNNGRIEDFTRIVKLIPTLKYLLEKNARLVVISHFGRPKGEFDRELSLAPLADALGQALDGLQVKFAIDCVGDNVRSAVDSLEPGKMLLLENLRFHAEEEANDDAFAKELASMADCYVNDAFSCSHREHASITGIPKHIPSAAGLLLQQEIESLEDILHAPEHPMTVITGGAKVSTKLALLKNLIKKTDHMIIGGAMANTFLKAQGYDVGHSLCENDLIDEAQSILNDASAHSCEIILPEQLVVARAMQHKVATQVVSFDKIPGDSMALDIGPDSVATIAEILKKSKTVVWNGPMGAFEYQPFDVGSISVARHIAALTQSGDIVSLAGGGDVVSALGCAGLMDHFSYVSTAGGAFLEWLEDKKLPGVTALL